MITQSFLYNAIFFTYALVLTKLRRQRHQLAAVLPGVLGGQPRGPLAPRPLFDTVGRRKMISGTYMLSGILLAVSAFLFEADVLNAYDPDAHVDRHLLLRLRRGDRPTSR